MSISQKGEISMEFIVMISLMLTMFLSMIVVIGMKSSDITESMIYSDAEKIADTVASEINTAARISGYYREFRIPEKIAGIEEYTVDIDQDLRQVLVKWKDRIEFSNIVTGNISGTVSPGTNRIRNEEELIVIES